ncbi:hypothetical protein B0H14DRAFT_3566546 [Mycena olivaceomarginata]|nr:hypothetical protein B0H14DRAFT_3566546 [Mycena olivaceomarginata]
MQMSSPQVTSSKPDLTGTHVAPEVVLRAGGNVGLAPEWQRGSDDLATSHLFSLPFFVLPCSTFLKNCGTLPCIHQRLDRAKADEYCVFVHLLSWCTSIRFLVACVHFRPRRNQPARFPALWSALVLDDLGKLGARIDPPPGSRSETHQARDARNYRQPSPLYRTRPPPSMCGTNTMLRARNTVISAVPASRDRDCTRVYRIPRNLKLVVNAKEINPDESPFPIGSPAP